MEANRHIEGGLTVWPGRGLYHVLLSSKQTIGTKCSNVSMTGEFIQEFNHMISIFWDWSITNAQNEVQDVRWVHSMIHFQFQRIIPGELMASFEFGM